LYVCKKVEYHAEKLNSGASLLSSLVGVVSLPSSVVVVVATISGIFGGNRVFSGFFRGPEKREVRHDGAQGRKECRAGQGVGAGGARSSLPPTDCK
jgi:hypothetical protein